MPRGGAAPQPYDAETRRARAKVEQPYDPAASAGQGWGPGAGGPLSGVQASALLCNHICHHICHHVCHHICNHIQARLMAYYQTRL